MQSQVQQWNRIRRKTTIQSYYEKNAGNKLHSYDITKIELLPPIANARQDAYTAVGNNSKSEPLPPSVGTPQKKSVRQDSGSGIELLKDDLVRSEERNPRNNNSISLANLIEGVELSYESGLARGVVVDQEAFKIWFGDWEKKTN